MFKQTKCLRLKSSNESKPNVGGRACPCNYPCYGRERSTLGTLPYVTIKVVHQRLHSRRPRGISLPCRDRWGKCRLESGRHVCRVPPRCWGSRLSGPERHSKPWTGVSKRPRRPARRAEERSEQLLASSSGIISSKQRRWGGRNELKKLASTSTLRLLSFSLKHFCPGQMLFDRSVSSSDWSNPTRGTKRVTNSRFFFITVGPTKGSSSHAIVSPPSCSKFSNV